MFWSSTRNRTYAVYEEQCHFLNKWEVHGVTACILLARSDAGLEMLCQHLRSVVLGRHHSKAFFPHFFCKNLGFVAFIPVYQACVIEYDVCGLIILWFNIDLSGISKV